LRQSTLATSASIVLGDLDLEDVVVHTQMTVEQFEVRLSLDHTMVLVRLTGASAGIACGAQQQIVVQHKTILANNPAAPVLTTLASANANGDISGRPVRVIARAEGATLSCNVDGATATATDTTRTHGLVGLATDHTKASWDYIVVIAPVG
jgi:hypothetical protein